jgi:hypothetical protein
MSSPWWDVPAVDGFRVVAAEFIRLMETHEKYAMPALVHATHSLLARLYLAGLLLPVKPESAFDEDPDEPTTARHSSNRPGPHQSRWRPLFRELSTKFGPAWNSYQEVFDPYANPPEAPVTGSLADDLSDIYCDLKRGEDYWASGEFDAAVWEWQFGFESHWSEHTTGALRAIRSLAANQGLGFPASAALDV